MNHLPARTTATPASIGTADALAALLARAERDIAAQGRAYRTDLDEDTAWRCAWNTWRTLTDLLPAVRALLDTPPEPTTPAAVRHLHAVPARAAA